MSSQNWGLCTMLELSDSKNSMNGAAFVTESLLSLVIVLSSCDLLPMEESCQHPSSGVINYNFKEGISFSHDEKEAAVAAACLVRHFYNNAFIANQDRRGPERSTHQP